ncbi:MAG: methyltransferase domain-containing protein [Anaerolineales bacterium]
MPKITDPQYLKTEQYKDASNLNARVEIHKRFSTNAYGWHRWVFDALEALPQQARILELGCGPAYLWAANADRIPVGWNITLSDLSDGMIDAARQSVSRSGHSFEFKQIDAQSIPFDDETFDVVIANHMLYHVPDRPKTIAEIRRVLRSPDAVSGRSPDDLSGMPGGRLIATTVGNQHMKELNAWLQRVSADPNFALFPLPFTLESGLAQLQPYFRQVEMRRYDDSLQITEIEPLMAYIHSSMQVKKFSESALAELRSDLERELQSKGRLFVGKDSGLFDAVK